MRQKPVSAATPGADADAASAPGADADAAADVAAAAARAALAVDVSLVDRDRWWAVGEGARSVSARLGALLRELYARAGAPAAVILVTHSRLLRQLFRERETAAFSATPLGVALGAQLVANCAVLRVVLADDAGEAPPRIAGAQFLFGSGFKGQR